MASKAKMPPCFADQVVSMEYMGLEREITQKDLDDIRARCEKESNRVMEELKTAPWIDSKHGMESVGGKESDETPKKKQRQVTPAGDG